MDIEMAQQYNLIFIIFPLLSAVLLVAVATVYMCGYKLQVRRCHCGVHTDQVKCSHLMVTCVFGCGEYIAPEMMKRHCQQQCSNAKKIILQQEDDNSAVPSITCTAVQETNETIELL